MFIYVHSNSVPSKTIRRFSSVELREAIENIETDDFTIRSQITSRQATESGSQPSTESVSEHFTESVSEPSTVPATELVIGMTNWILCSSENYNL